MADLDAEFALFQAELASLEEKAAETTEQQPPEQPEAASESKKRPRNDDDDDRSAPPARKKPASASAPAPVVIAAKPKIYSAPPRPAPVRDVAAEPATAIATVAGSRSGESYTDGADGGAAAHGALSGFPAGTTGEFAATAGMMSSSRSQMPMPRVDMVTGQLLSSEEQHQMNMQQSVYEYDPNRPVRSSGAAPNEYGKPKRNLRMAGGEIWEDPTMADWPDNDFRLFIGDLGNEVNDEILSHAFSRYASFQRARVVRDKQTHKTRGYGFVSFGDPFDCVKAMREMNGKYIGNRPVKIQKSRWQDRNIDVARKKAKKKNKHHLFG
ncbi:hypothetical protein P43SY_000769 [Pythium insidiosum]|uniref:RRM domain-containing protein n=1 Tax=Pythium insidiosum TaxID=114742 RepID=A0AAD5LWY0_PYTIN|nr:hypothetical protein P43SY_000769 [Pythium insidiosum]